MAEASLAVWRKCLLYGMLGMVYGIMLSCAGISAMGAGHGTCSAMEVLSALFGFYGQTKWLEWTPPLFWCGIGFLLGSARIWGPRLAFIAIMTVHYAALTLTEVRQDAIGQISQQKYGNLLIHTIVTYGLGQLAVWAIFVVELIRGNRGSKRGQV
jgi:hypothetical protein